MGTIGKESSQEDSQYYEKVSFELNILVCGNYNQENIERDLKEIQLVENHEGVTYIRKGLYKVIPEWKYFFFEKDNEIGSNTFKFIENSILRKKNFKNLILFYSGLNDYSVNDFLTYYDQKVRPNYYPYILIISRQNENINLPNLSKLNKNFIKLCKENDIIDIKINIIEIATYYNQLGDEIGFPKKLNERELLEKDNYLITKYPFTINILLCGRPGAGKSTLINRILGKQKSYAKIGNNSITSKIVKYIHEKYPLVLYDSPGFETNDNITSVQNLITQKNKTLNEEKNRIHCIFYLLNQKSERGFYGNEYQFLSSLIEQNLDLYIITTHAENEDNSEEFIEATRIQIMQSSNGNEEIENLRNYIYPVELIEERGYRRFGIAKLFNSIYNRYTKEKIKNEITQNNINQIRSIFLKDILTKKDLKKKLKALSLRVKANFKLLAASLGKDASVKGTTMLSVSVIKIISNIYNQRKTTDECLNIIESKGYTNEFKNSEDKKFRQIEKGFASVFYFNGPASKEVDYIANYLIETYSSEIDKDRNFYRFLNDYRIAINNAIDSLRNINDD